MIPHSIIGAALAAEALGELSRNPERCVHVGPSRDGVRLSIRRTVGGQLFVSCTVELPYEHSGMRRLTREQYLRVADEQRALNRIVTEMWRQSKDPVLAAREQLYQLCETREVPDSWFTEPPLPNTMDYDGMTLADIEAWTPLLAALPRKAPQVTP